MQYLNITLVPADSIRKFIRIWAFSPNSIPDLIWLKIPGSPVCRYVCLVAYIDIERTVPVPLGVLLAAALHIAQPCSATHSRIESSFIWWNIICQTQLWFTNRMALDRQWLNFNSHSSRLHKECQSQAWIREEGDGKRLCCYAHCRNTAPYIHTYIPTNICNYAYMQFIQSYSSFCSTDSYMYTCILIYIHTCKHTYVHTHIHIQTWAYIIIIHMHIYICTHMHTVMHFYAYLLAFICTYIYSYMHTFILTCICT